MTRTSCDSESTAKNEDLISQKSRSLYRSLLIIRIWETSQQQKLNNDRFAWEELLADFEFQIHYKKNNEENDRHFE
jgi:hypothetical protein